MPLIGGHVPFVRRQGQNEKEQQMYFSDIGSDHPEQSPVFMQFYIFYTAWCIFKSQRNQCAYATIFQHTPMF
ncbi:MAG TPA: hypothetical protein VJ603_01245 [Paucimonas sp.]|nr:hypothetical protein [Paucimonas sp.]